MLYALQLANGESFLVWSYIQSKHMAFATSTPCEVCV